MPNNLPSFSHMYINIARTIQTTGNIGGCTIEFFGLENTGNNKNRAKKKRLVYSISGNKSTQHNDT